MYLKDEYGLVTSSWSGLPVNPLDKQREFPDDELLTGPDSVVIVSLEPLPNKLVKRLPYLYSSYLRYVPVTVMQKLAITKVADSLRRRDCVPVCVREQGQIVGLACWRKTSQDPETAGQHEADLEFMLAGGDYVESEPIYTDLVNSVLSGCIAHGIAQVNAQVDAENIPVLQVLQNTGFEIATEIFTLALRSDWIAPLDPDKTHRICLLHQADLGEVLQMTRASQLGSMTRQEEHRLRSLLIQADVAVACRERSRLLAYIACRKSPELSSLLGTECGEAEACSYCNDRLGREAELSVLAASLHWFQNYGIQIIELRSDVRSPIDKEWLLEAGLRVAPSRFILRKYIS